MAGQPVHAAPRRLRARDADDRGAGGVRGAAPGADPARRRAAPEVDASFLHGDFPAEEQRALRGARRPDAAVRRRRLAARSDRAPVLHVVLEPRRPPHDALPARTTSRSVWSTMHEAGHGLYAHGIARQLAHAALDAARRSASTSRRAAPGRTSSAARGRSGATGTAAAGALPGRSAESSSTPSSARSTARSRR